MKFDTENVSGIKLAKTFTILPACELKFSTVISRLENKGHLGFTLAEVLITLVIIGVIAALAIPTLLSKYQKYTYVVGLKKANSLLQNAYKMVPLIQNCPDGDYECAGWQKVSTGAVTFEGITFNYANQLDLYLLSKAFKNIDFKTNNDGKEFSETYSVRVDGVQKNTRQDYESYGFVTPDGMTFTSSGGSGIFVDVNGKKGPNIMGRDIFIFQTHTDTLMPAGYEYTGEDARLCNANTSGYYCAARVLREDKMDY